MLDSSSSIYAGLGWRRDADDLAVLRSQAGEMRDGSAHAVLAWRGSLAHLPSTGGLSFLERDKALKAWVSEKGSS